MAPDVDEDLDDEAAEEMLALATKAGDRRRDASIPDRLLDVLRLCGPAAVVGAVKAREEHVPGPAMISALEERTREFRPAVRKAAGAPKPQTPEATHGSEGSTCARQPTRPPSYGVNSAAADEQDLESFDVKDGAGPMADPARGFHADTLRLLLA